MKMNTQTKSTRYVAGARTFDIVVRASHDGYHARVFELLADGLLVPVALVGSPKQHIHPSIFYPSRQHYRGELVGMVKGILGNGVVSRLNTFGPGETADQYDSFIRANLIGWPDGYPDAVDDDMADWCEPGE